MLRRMPANVPKHVGVMLDGNRRWARSVGQDTAHGHRAGAANIEPLLGWCDEVGIEVVTLWLLSTDNLNRPERELAALLDIIGDSVEGLAAAGRWRVHPVGALDLLPAATAVPDRDVDHDAVDLAGGLLGGLELLGGAGGQQVEGADGVEPPPALVGEGGDGLLDDLQQGLELAGGAVEVVGREQPQRDVLDADLLAPPEHRLDVGGAGAVPVGGVGTHGARPAAVAVEHHPDVARQVLGGHPAQHPRFVRRVEHPSEPALPVRHSSMVAAAGLPQRTPRRAR